MLFETPRVNQREADVIDQITTLKSKLGYLVSSTPERWTGILRRNAFARAVRGSNSIEGYHWQTTRTSRTRRPSFAAFTT